MPTGGGGTAGLISGIVKGFGSTALEIEDRNFQAKQRDKQNRISILQSAVDNENLDDESRQAALDQLGELIDGKPGGKKGLELKALLDPILAVGKLLGGSGGNKTSKPNEPMSELPPAPKPPTGGGGFETAALAPGAIQAAPRPRMTIKTQATKQAEKTAGALAVNAATIRQTWGLEDERNKELKARMPAEKEAELERLTAIALKYGGYKTLADVPQSMRDAIFEKVEGLKIDAPVVNKPQKLGATVKGPNLPLDAVDMTGEQITDRADAAEYSAFKNADGSLSFQRNDRKALASEVEHTQRVKDAVAAGIPAAKADTYVRQQQFQLRRQTLINAQELGSGRQLANKLKQDLSTGVVTAATAKYWLSDTEQAALRERRKQDAFADDADPRFKDKSIEEIQRMMIPELGLPGITSKQDLIDATVGKKPATTTTTTTTRKPIGSFEGK